MNFIFMGLFFLVLSFIFIKFSIPILKNYLSDNPGYRSSHLKPTPSGGGIIFSILGSIGCSFFNYWIPFLLLPISFIGFIDDLKSLSNKVRFFFQMFILTILILNSKLYLFLTAEYDFYFSIVVFLLFLFLSLSIVNFVNFMDGLDGLVSISGVILFCFICFYINASLTPLLGALIGFTIFNYQPARVFMGDAGSTYLGAVYVGVFLDSTTFHSFWTISLVLSPLLFDAFFTLCRRFFAGDNIFTAHKKHLYQRLQQSGWSHSKVSNVFGIATFVMSLACFITFNIYMILYTLLLIIFIGAYLDFFIAKPFISDK